MCLVELKGSIKPIVSCSMSAKGSLSSNTQLYTNSPLVKKARENVLEFLLLNHPLDCPICDQGGECDLQDQSLFFGFTKKRFYTLKRVVTDKNIGPVVKTVMTRCIHCTRCVRFATEIAGVEDLGVFGRGMNSEIGTYVGKAFQSELSGNVIDLCPVGALTSKSHPFIGRKWELKIVSSVDFFDGFALNTQVLLKNNRVVRVMPGFNHYDQMDNWITDKARFSFDGMFSAEREFKILRVTGKKDKPQTKLSWNSVFKELVYYVYFFDHLNKHVSRDYKLSVIFNSNVSLEVLSLLNLLAKKYYFFQVRKNDNNNQINNDLEVNFQLNLTLTQNILSLTNYCILIGVNTRFEGSYLNIKLRQRYKKGNFKVFSLGSLTDLTYPVSYVGSTLKSLKTLVEGNSLNCQDLNSLYYYPPVTICSSELYSRHDSNAVFELLSILKHQTTNFITKYSSSKTNVLNSTINNVGSNVLNLVKTFSVKDFKNSRGIYLINTPITSVSIQKILELKLLDYFYIAENSNPVLIEQNSIPSGLNTNNYYNLYSYLFLPTNVFYETNNTYINTEGLVKKALKSISTIHDTKSDWQIIRKFFSYSNTFLCSGSINNLNKKIQFDCDSLFNFKSFISFLYYSPENLTNLSFYLTVKNTAFDFTQTKYKSSVSKVHNTTFKRWYDDFYLGSNTYSNYSYTMVECSSTFRKVLTNFSSIN